MRHLADAMAGTGLKNRGRLAWFLVLSSLLAVYLLSNLVLPDLMTGWSRVYVALPILWCLVAVGVVLASRYGTGGRIRFSRSLLWTGLLMGVIHVCCLVIAGVLDGFGYSPYIHTPYGIFLNTVYFGCALVGVEFARAYLLSEFEKRYTVLMVVGLGLLFTVISVPMTRLTNPGSDSVLPFIGGTLLPLFAENMLAGFLALLGGPVAAIAYRLALEAFEWYSPILPALEWVIRAFVGVLVPVACLMWLQKAYGEPRPEASPKARPAGRTSLVAWLATAVIAVALVWFTFGVVGFHPVVIVSGSMSPSIQVGDVAVVKEVSASEINEGDVIQYVLGGSSTVHRVIDVEGDGSQIVFLTQGDANEDPDAQPVSPEQIKGKVSLVLPKVGWVSIGIKNLVSRVF